MKSQPARLNRLHGFTMIELLAVLAIVVVLAALVLVASTKIRDRAKMANAMNSLRQIGIAHVSYSTENRGAVNTIGQAEEDEDIEFSGSFWGRMLPHLFTGLDEGTGNVNMGQLEHAINALLSTSNARTMVGTPFSGAPVLIEAGLPVPIAFNEVLRPSGGQQVRMTIFQNPTRTIYATYGREFFNSSHGANFTEIPESSSTDPGIFYLGSQNAIICFLDGHIETLTPPIPRRLFGEQDDETED